MKRSASESIIFWLQRYLNTYPMLRFCQALFNVGILEMRVEVMGESAVMVDPYYRTDVETWELMQKALKGRYQLRPINSGVMYTVADFTEECKRMWFVNNDGYGYYATAEGVSDILVHPKDLVEGDIDPRCDEKLTHINWFNK